MDKVLTNTTEMKTVFDPEVILPKANAIKSGASKFFKKHTKIVIALFIVLLIAGGIYKVRQGKAVSSSAKLSSSAKSTSVSVDKSYDFPALNNQGVASKYDKIKFKVVNAEKTNEVLVGDKTFTSKNQKLFLILNLELRNDSTSSYNITPGDLIRLSYGSDESRKFAPDLHNNLVPVSPISTKLDRVGFVIPETEKNFKIFIGELEGKKETITISFAS